MCVKDALECEKGDMSRQGLSYEIVIEQSSPNSEEATYSMWKRVRGMENEFKRELSVWHCYREERKMRFAEPDLKWTTDEVEARKAYEKCCDENGCSPYPEAEAYFKRK